MLYKYNINQSKKYNYRYHSNSSALNEIAEYVFKSIPIDKTKKVDLKRRFLLNVLINLKVSVKTNKYISYNRKADAYTLKPDRYRFDYEKYNIAIGIMNALESAGLIENELGFKNLNDGTGRISKCIPTDSLIKLLNKVTSKDFTELPSKESIVLKSRYDKKLIDYSDTKNTIKMRRLVNEYNDMRQRQVIQLNKLTQDEITQYSDYLFQYANESEIKPGEIINLKNPFVYRVFNDNFNLGGRFYNGIETNMPKVLRDKILINGEQTVEKDFNSMHIRMLYHKTGIDYKDDAYDELSNGDSVMRKVYKLIGLTVINSKDMKSCVLAIRKSLVENDLNDIIDITDSGIIQLIHKWNEKHKRISQYFNTDMGIKLQRLDAQIAENIIKKFINDNEVVLCIHDSFIVRKSIENKLVKNMSEEYKNVINFEGILKS